MKTYQYIKKFRLDDPQYSNHFNTDLFLQDLNEEFKARIEREKAERKKAGLEFTYRIFQIIIQEMQTKFCAISNKKAGGPLRTELWNAFYAKYIIPAREADFPKEHAEIQVKREAYERGLIKEQVIEEMGIQQYTYLKSLVKQYRDPKAIEELKAFQKEVDIEVEKRYRAKKEEMAQKKSPKKTKK